MRTRKRSPRKQMRLELSRLIEKDTTGIRETRQDCAIRNIEMYVCTPYI